MFSLPRAFAGLGLLGGAVITLCFAALTCLTLGLLLRASERLHAATYSSTLRALWGRPAAAAVRASVLLASYGFMVLHLLIIHDVVFGEGGVRARVGGCVCFGAAGQLWLHGAAPPHHTRRRLW
jgi:amino acid permease